MLDESQCLPDKTLDEIPLLLNFKMDSIDPLLMIMIGHPDLGRRLQRPMFRNIHQRILLTYRLPPLDEAETKNYVCHHLKLAALNRGVLQQKATLDEEDIYQASDEL